MGKYLVLSEKQVALSSYYSEQGINGRRGYEQIYNLLTDLLSVKGIHKLELSLSVSRENGLQVQTQKYYSVRIPQKLFWVGMWKLKIF